MLNRKELIILFLLVVGVFAENFDESSECDRFRPEEFLESVFKPFMEVELAWLKETYYMTLSGVEEILDGIRDKRSQSEQDDDIKSLDLGRHNSLIFSSYSKINPSFFSCPKLQRNWRVVV